MTRLQAGELRKRVGEAATNAAYEPPCVRAVAADHVASTASYMTSGGFTDEDDGIETGEQLTRREFLEVLQEHFGFDERAAQLIDIALSCMIAFCASADGDQALKTAWAFFRTIGAMVYGRSGAGATMWEMTAGSAENVYNGAVLQESQQGGAIVTEDEFFTDVLGMDEWQYRRLRYQVWVQHELCGHRLEALQNDTNTNERYNSLRSLRETAEASYSLAYGSSLPFENEWEGLKRRMALMPDFAHFCITLSAHLATALGYVDSCNTLIDTAFPGPSLALGGPIRAREALAGWLGDACIAKNGQTSFRWDDYWADIDALGIASCGSALGHDVRAMFCDYYLEYGEQIEGMACFERKGVFLQYLVIGEVVDAINSFPSLSVPRNLNELLAYLQTREGYEDTYRFLCRITKSAAELAEFGCRESYHATTSYLYTLGDEEDI